MELKKITEAQSLALREPLPKEAISQHPTKAYLSTIKAIYVVERLNSVFGIGEWKVRNEVEEKVVGEIVANKKKPDMVVVKSIFKINGLNIRIEAYGGNDNADLGDAYKGACTDALTKIGSYLEIGINVFKGLGDKASPAKKSPVQIKTTPAPVTVGERKLIQSFSSIEKLGEYYKKNKVGKSQEWATCIKVRKAALQKLIK